MLSLRWFCASASLVSLVSLVPSLATADEASLADWARERVNAAVVKPLTAAESHRFTRARPPPRERRIRIPQETATNDESGHPFVAFAIDSRFAGGDWREGDIVGCAYTGTGKVFVKRGDEYRPASFLLGKNEDPVAGVCEAAPSP